jgi:coenzyme PQQ synthesis protein D (PqqD)
MVLEGYRGAVPELVVRRRSSGILASADGDNLVLLDLRNAKYLTLNPTGGFLWDALEQPKTVRDLVALVEQAYMIPEDQATQAVTAFLASLDARTLLEPQDL